MASKRDEVSATYSATSQGLDTSRTFGRQGKKGLRGLRAPISAAAKAKGVQLIDEFRAEAVDLEMPRPQLVARAASESGGGTGVVMDVDVVMMIHKNEIS